MLGDDHRVLGGGDLLTVGLPLPSFSEAHLLIHFKISPPCNRQMRTGRKDEKDKRMRKTARCKQHRRPGGERTGGQEERRMRLF